MKFYYKASASRPVMAAVACCALWLPVSVAAQGVQTADADQKTANATLPAATGPAAADTNEIVVSGIRQSLEDALEIRRNADVILDGISADDIGSTPDLNLGEALARIPGVQINREGARRNATISIRGLPGRFTQTTLQGQRIASTTRGSNTGNPFGIFESSIFNGANVLKSFTADTPSGGLAAQVDLRIRSALDRREGLVARAELGYEETTQDWNPAFFLSGSTKVGSRLGLYGTVAYSDQSFRRDTFRVNNYREFSAADLAGFTAGTRPSGTGDTVSLVANSAFDIAAEGENGLRNAVIRPNEIRQFTQTNSGYRLSAGAGLAYELSSDLTFRVDGIYTRRDLKDANQDIFIFAPQATNQSLVSPLSNPVPIGVVDYDDNGTAENVFLVPRILVSDQLTAIGNRSFPSLDESWAIYPQFNFENDDWRIDVIGTYSEATGRSALSQYDVRLRQRNGVPDSNGDGIDDAGTGQFGIYDTGLGDLGSVFVNNVVPADLLDFSNPVGSWSIEAGSAIGARASFPVVSPNGATFNSPISILVAGFDEGVKRDLASVDFDIARKFNGGAITEIAAGGFYSRENADRFRTENSAIGLNFPAITSDILRLNDGVSRGGEFLGGKIPGVELDQFLSVNIPVIEQLLGAPSRTLPPGLVFNPTAANLRGYFPELTNASAQSVTVDEILQALPEVPGTGFLQRLPQRRVIDDNYTSERETVELYGMVKFDLTDVSDHPLRGNVGLRYVRTDLNGQVRPVSTEFYDNLAAIRAANGGAPLEFREGAIFNFPVADNSFERWLPSVNLIYEITPDLVVRAAHYHTFEAIDLAEFSPSPTLLTRTVGGEDPDDPGDTAGLPTTLVEVSNLAVKPRRSVAYDVGISWYNRPGSVISLGFFKKSLIGDITRFNNFCPEGENVTFGGETFNNLSLDAGRCQFINNDGDPERVRIRLTQNNPDTINVTGFEGQIQQRLDFLPGLLKNTGFVLNYTRVRSGGDNDVQLFNVAEDTYNIIGYYEDDLLQARLAYNKQSEIELQGGSSFTGGSSRVAPRGQLDFTGAVKPMKGLELRFELFNITNSSRREYIGFEELLRVFEYDGRTYSMSATYRF